MFDFEKLILVNFNVVYLGYHMSPLGISVLTAALTLFLSHLFLPLFFLHSPEPLLASPGILPCFKCSAPVALTPALETQPVLFHSQIGPLLESFDAFYTRAQELPLKNLHLGLVRLQVLAHGVERLDGILKKEAVQAVCFRAENLIQPGCLLLVT